MEMEMEKTCELKRLAPLAFGFLVENDVSKVDKCSLLSHTSVHVTRSFFSQLKLKQPCFNFNCC